MKRELPYIVLVLAVSVGLAACGGGASVKTEVPVEDQSVPGGGQTGAAGGPGAEGEALGGGTRVAMAAQRPDKLRVHFAFDSSAIDAEARAVIEAHAAYLAANPEVKLGLGGHCDERGTREYNLALGERRGQAVERMLRILGIGPDRLSTNSYGEEEPLALGHNESAWRLNRRVEFTY